MNTTQQLQVASIVKGIPALKQPEFQVPRLQELLGDLEAAYEAITRLSSQQATRTTSDGTRRALLRDALRERHLLRISKDAQLYLEGLPGVKTFFHVPHKRVKDEALLEATDRVLKHAKEHEDIFIARRYRRDFIKRAQAAADALKAQMEDTDTVVSRRSAATSALKRAIRKGRKVMDSIDRNVAAELADNPDALRSWASAYRIPQKRGRPKNNRRARQIFPVPNQDS